MQYPKSALLLSRKAFFKHARHCRDRDGITGLIFFVQFLFACSTEITLTATVGFFPELHFISGGGSVVKDGAVLFGQPVGHLRKRFGRRHTDADRNAGMHFCESRLSSLFSLPEYTPAIPDPS